MVPPELPRQRFWIIRACRVVLTTGDWGSRVRTVRLTDWTSQWTSKDVIEFVEGAGSLAVRSAVPDGKNVFVFGPDTAAAQAISQVASPA